MILKIIFTLWMVSFLIGCVVAYVKHRKEKKEMDEAFVRELKLIQHQLDYNKTNQLRKIEL
jgi:cbb3-type cytochrome oxidase subunit 3